MSSQAAVLTFHASITTIAAVVVYYLLQRYWWYALGAAVAGAAVYRFPRYATWLALGVVVPALLIFMLKHYVLAALTIGLAVLAFTMADADKQHQLEAAVGNLWGPLVSAAKTGVTDAKQAATVTRERVEASVKAAAQKGQAMETQH